MFSGKVSGTRPLAGQLCRAVLGVCVLTAICSLAPTFGQSLPPVVLPGLIDALLHAPPVTGTYAYNSFVPALSIGASYTDPVFGTTVRRVTNDNVNDAIYARNMWWNADGTRYIHNGKIINLATNTVEYTGIPLGSGSPNSNTNVGFDPVDPNAYYYYSGSTIHKITLQAGGTWTDAIYFTAPGGATIGDIGGTLNWLDASGRYMLVRYGAEPSVHVYDRQNIAAGPYANPVDGHVTADSNGYVGISPDGQFLVGYEDNAGIGVVGYVGVSWKIDHVNRTIASAPNIFWSLSGDHGSFISASDGRNYMIVFDTYDADEIWRVDITNNANGLTYAQQKALPHNQRLLGPLDWSVTGHLTTVAKGALKDWAFFSAEDANDGFNGPTSPWFLYRQEIIGLNVMTGEVRRLAHHRSRSLGANYFYEPKLSVSWGGEFVGWASNFNQNTGGTNIYAVPFAATATTPPKPPKNLRAQ